MSSDVIKLIMSIMMLGIIVIVAFFSENHIKKEEKRLNKIEEDRLKLKKETEERTFTIVDILRRNGFVDNGFCEHILIKDTDSKKLYAYSPNYDTYSWTEEMPSHLEPFFYDDSEAPCLLEYESFDDYPLKFNKTGGKYKLMEELGHFEVKDDKVIIYYNNPKKRPLTVKMTGIKQGNHSNNLYYINNVKIIDCYIIYEKDS